VKKKKMKSTKAMVLSICAVLLVAMAGAGMAVAADENAGVVSDTGNSDGSVGGSTYSFSMGPGGSYSKESTLHADAPADYDTWKMTVKETCTVTVVVKDLYITGDTIALKAGKKIYDATSPDAIKVSKTLAPGTYTFYTGYLDCPGGYGAGYGVTVTAS